MLKQGIVEHDLGIGDVRTQTLAVAEIFPMDFFK